MERYIIRNEQARAYSINTNEFDAELCMLFMKEFYKYKDILDYNSWLYIITTTYYNKPHMTWYNENIYLDRYEVTNTIARRYIDSTTEGNGSSNYTCRKSTITIPRAVLLFDKNDKCRYVDVSTKLLRRLYELRVNHQFYENEKHNEVTESSREKNGVPKSNPFGTLFNNKTLIKLMKKYNIDIYDFNFVNIGKLIYTIDVSYDNKLNSICNSVLATKEETKRSYIVPIDLIPFISKNIPDLCNYNEYGRLTDAFVPEYLIKFIVENLDSIKKDLLIEDQEFQIKDIEYISIKHIINEEKEKRRAQLLEELRALDAE